MRTFKKGGFAKTIADYRTLITTSILQGDQSVLGEPLNILRVLAGDDGDKKEICNQLDAIHCRLLGIDAETKPEEIAPQEGHDFTQARIDEIKGLLEKKRLEASHAQKQLAEEKPCKATTAEEIKKNSEQRVATRNAIASKLRYIEKLQNLLNNPDKIPAAKPYLIFLYQYVAGTQLTADKKLLDDLKARVDSKGNQFYQFAKLVINNLSELMRIQLKAFNNYGENPYLFPSCLFAREKNYETEVYEKLANALLSLNWNMGVTLETHSDEHYNEVDLFQSIFAEYIEKDNSNIQFQDGSAKSSNTAEKNPEDEKANIKWDDIYFSTRKAGGNVSGVEYYEPNHFQSAKKGDQLHKAQALTLKYRSKDQQTTTLGNWQAYLRAEHYESKEGKSTEQLRAIITPLEYTNVYGLGWDTLKKSSTDLSDIVKVICNKTTEQKGIETTPKPITIDGIPIELTPLKLITPVAKIHRSYQYLVLMNGRFDIKPDNNTLAPLNELNFLARKLSAQALLELSPTVEQLRNHEELTINSEKYKLNQEALYAQDETIEKKQKALQNINKLSRHLTQFIAIHYALKADLRLDGKTGKEYLRQQFVLLRQIRESIGDENGTNAWIKNLPDDLKDSFQATLTAIQTHITAHTVFYTPEVHKQYQGVIDEIVKGIKAEENALPQVSAASPSGTGETLNRNTKLQSVKKPFEDLQTAIQNLNPASTDFRKGVRFDQESFTAQTKAVITSNKINEHRKAMNYFYIGCTGIGLLYLLGVAIVNGLSALFSDTGRVSTFMPTHTENECAMFARQAQDGALKPLNELMGAKSNSVPTLSIEA